MALFPGVKSHEKSCVLGFGGTTLAPETGSVMPELLDMLIDRILGSLCSPCILFSVYGGIPALYPWIAELFRELPWSGWISVHFHCIHILRALGRQPALRQDP